MFSCIGYRLLYEEFDPRKALLEDINRLILFGPHNIPELKFDYIDAEGILFH